MWTAVLGHNYTHEIWKRKKIAMELALHYSGKIGFEIWDAVRLFVRSKVTDVGLLWREQSSLGWAKFKDLCFSNHASIELVLNLFCTKFVSTDKFMNEEEGAKTSIHFIYISITHISEHFLFSLFLLYLSEVHWINPIQKKNISVTLLNTHKGGTNTPILVQVAHYGKWLCDGFCSINWSSGEIVHHQVWNPHQVNLVICLFLWHHNRYFTN